jgi:CRP-like cAMP-binding protein
MLGCLGAQVRAYGKGEAIHWEGDLVNEVGILLAGRAHSVKDDPSGRAVIVTVLGPGSYIGILLAAGRDKASPVTVEAQTALTAAFFPVKRILGRCPRQCPQHDQLLANFLAGVAEKALHLHERNDCLVKPSVREKTLAYLKKQERERGRPFRIPLDRAGMARYLNVERSALSRELSRMREAGLINYRKDEFRLLP